MQTSKVIEIFGRMTLYGFSPDDYTYNFMVILCSNIGCYKSACAFVSLMTRDGYFPDVVTYTALIKILMLYEDFGEALKLLDLASSDTLPDVVLYNTILQTASVKGRIDILEFLVEKMHREKIQPDPLTCSNVYTAYTEQGFHATGVEALQVLSLRMISEDDVILQERRNEFEDLIMSEDGEAESLILQQFKNSSGYVEAALLNLRWCAILGFSISWFPNQSPWAKRLSNSYSGINIRELLSSKYKFRFTRG